MKKLTLILVILIYSISISAQDIKFRRLLDDGGISIMTTTLRVFPWGGRAIEYALQYEAAPVEGMYQGYYLHVYFNSDINTLQIPQGGKILLKTTQGNIISLVDCGEKEFKEYDTYYNSTNYSYRKKSYYDDTMRTHRYKIHGKYIISEEELTQIINEGVIKIRIETNGDNIEYNYKNNDIQKNKTAKVINNLYCKLLSQINPYYGLTEEEDTKLTEIIAQ